MPCVHPCGNLLPVTTNTAKRMLWDWVPEPDCVVEFDAYDDLPEALVLLASVSRPAMASADPRALDALDRYLETQQRDAFLGGSRIGDSPPNITVASTPCTSAITMNAPPSLPVPAKFMGAPA